MRGIGFVSYAKGDQPGALVARWCHSVQGAGTGMATGQSGEGFAGDYRIRYFDASGALVAERELRIRDGKGVYELHWLKEGRVVAEGIGHLTGGLLTAGWHDLAD